jgi:hypothetical protein
LEDIFPFEATTSEVGTYFEEIQESSVHVEVEQAYRLASCHSEPALTGAP